MLKYYAIDKKLISDKLVKTDRSRALAVTLVDNKVKCVSPSW